MASCPARSSAYDSPSYGQPGRPMVRVAPPGGSRRNSAPQLGQRKTVTCMGQLSRPLPSRDMYGNIPIHGIPDSFPAESPRFRAGVRHPEPFRPDGAGDRGAVRHRGEKRLLLPGRPGAEGVFTEAAAPPPPDRVHIDGRPVPLPPARPRAGPGPRGPPPRGGGGGRRGTAPRPPARGRGRGLRPPREG